MTTPPLTPYAQVPAAGVYTQDGIKYSLKTAEDSSVDLATGHITGPADPSLAVIYLPGAKLVLG